jgi:hypothetical protein
MITQLYNCMKIKCFLFFVALTSSTLMVWGQSDEKYPLSQSQLNKVINRKFGNLVTGTNGSGAIASYGSLDIANAAFAFKGTIPFTSRKNDTGKISYLTIGLNGNIIGTNATSLFTNSVLNTDVSLSLQYNFMLPSMNRVGYFGSDAAKVKLRKEMISTKWAKDRRETDRKYAPGAINYALQATLAAQQKVDSPSIARLQYFVDSLQKELSGKYADNKSDEYATKLSRELLDTAQEKLKKINTLTDLLQHDVDSLKKVLANFRDLRSYERQKLEQQQNSDMDSLVFKFPLQSYVISWFSIGGSGGKKTYTTFDPTASFESQIKSDQHISTYNIGLSYNWYYNQPVYNRIFYASLGLSYLRDNNTTLLTTTEVTDSRKNVNAGADTTRTWTKKYNAFKDSVTQYNAWSVTGQFYMLFGARPSGFHIFPTLNFRNDNLKILNIGVGYVVSFMNTKKDQPIINAEIYYKFLDMFDQQKTGKDFWNRNDIGITLTLPINLFLN